MFGVVTLFYTKIHNEFFIFLGVALHYTIHHKNKFVFNNKMKYNPNIDKKILKQALIDGFSMEQVKKILINSPNIKSEKMIDLIYRSLSHDKDLKNIVNENTIYL